MTPLNPPLIQNLIDATDVAIAGGKAVNFGELLRANFPVPNGFVITTHAYRAAHRLPEIPPDLRSTILTAYHALNSIENRNSKIENPPIVAVRSSATAEDMAGASMAGQYDTFLDIHDDASLLAAIRACWASIDSPRIRAYLQSNNIPIDKVAMAVVVQKLVPADVAGVMFTVNPHTGSREEMLIEAAWGLGETVVSGRVQPDVLRIRAHDGHSLEHTISDKQIMIRPRNRNSQTINTQAINTQAIETQARHGNALPPSSSPPSSLDHSEEPVPDHQRRIACLESSHIAQLHALGLRAAAHFKSPQDIEWAIADGQLYQLQSRPITTLAGVEAYHDVLANTKTQLQQLTANGRGPWVLHNLAETLPHPTPLTWSIIAPFMSASGGFGNMYRLAGFQPFGLPSSSSPNLAPNLNLNPSENWTPDTGNFLTLIAGRVYMDSSLAPSMFFPNYPYKYDTEILRTNPEAGQLPPTLPAGGLLATFRAARQISRANAKLHQLAQTFDADLRRTIIPAFTAWCSAEKSRDLSQLSNSQLAELWLARKQKVLSDFAPQSLLPSLIAGILIEDLRAFCAENYWNENAEELANTLASPLDPDKTLLANSALYQVGTGNLPAESWLAEFGHRGPNEFDLAAPRWRERPLELTAMAARLRNGPDPASHHHTHLEKIRSLQSSLAAQLSPSAQSQFNSLIDSARRYMIYREDGKFYLMLGYALLRQTAQEFARRLTPASPDDIFYLPESQILGAMPSRVPREGGGRESACAQDSPIALAPSPSPLETGNRTLDTSSPRLRHAAETRLVLPRYIDASAIPSLGNPAADLDSSAPKYPAFALSTGSARGPVRIVQDPATAGDLGTGYILVCTSTDPAWTPLFISAAGVVLECGGTLSHGAVVAREMGIPAVVLPDATKLLQESETITVDGHSGAIYRAQSGASVPTGSSPTDPHSALAPSPSSLETGHRTLDTTSTKIPPTLTPPPPGNRERLANKIRTTTLLLWSLYLLAAFCLPSTYIYDPSLQFLDTLLWPLVRSLGKPGTVALIALLMAAATMLGQYFLTDTPRLREAKKRANLLTQESSHLDASPRRTALRAAAAPVQSRVMGATFVPLAVFLAPMVMIFMWLPARVDPAAASAPAGSDLAISATVDTDFPGTLSLQLPPGFHLKSPAPQLQPIRRTLQELLADQPALDKLRADPNTPRGDLAASLRAYLNALPPQTLVWNIATENPTTQGPFTATLHLTPSPQSPTTNYQLPSSPTPIPFVLGEVSAPIPLTLEVIPHSPIQSIKVTPLKTNTHPTFFPIPLLFTTWDIGWIGVYLLAYLPAMLALKFLLRLP